MFIDISPKTGAIIAFYLKWVVVHAKFQGERGKMRKSLIILASIIFVALFGATARADLITNGSFELLPDNYDLPSGSWTTYASIPGWTASLGSIEVRNNVAGIAQDGDNFVELDSYGNSTMYSQTVITIPGQEYVLSFWYAPRPGVDAASNGIQLLLNNTLIDQLTDFSNTNDSWRQRIFTVSGTGSDVISFAAIGTDDSYGGSIDNVSMQVASVPEPTSLILLGTGLGVVGLTARRRRK